MSKNLKRGSKMSTQIQNATPEQTAQMKKIADLAQEAMNIILEYENSFAGNNAVARAHEFMFWGHSMILNDVKKLSKEGELIQNEQIISSKTIN